MVGVGGALEAEDGVGDGVVIALARCHLRRDDVLIAQEARDTGVVVVQISFQPLENLLQCGRLCRLRTQRGRQPKKCNKRNGRR
jgi:hypothetical protein